VPTLPPRRQHAPEAETVPTYGDLPISGIFKMGI